MKPDQLIKRRGKLGLIKAGTDLAGVKDWLTTRLGKEFKVITNIIISFTVPGRAVSIADPGAESSILAQFHTFVESEIVFAAILFPQIQEGLADHPDMTIAVDWDVKNQTKSKLQCIYIVLHEVYM